MGKRIAIRYAETGMGKEKIKILYCIKQRIANIRLVQWRMTGLMKLTTTNPHMCRLITVYQDAPRQVHTLNQKTNISNSSKQYKLKLFTP